MLILIRAFLLFRPNNYFTNSIFTAVGYPFFSPNLIFLFLSCLIFAEIIAYFLSGIFADFIFSSSSNYCISLTLLASKLG